MPIGVGCIVCRCAVGVMLSGCCGGGAVEWQRRPEQLGGLVVVVVVGRIRVDGGRRWAVCECLCGRLCGKSVWLGRM